MCLQDFPFVIVLAFCNSHSCLRKSKEDDSFKTSNFQEVQDSQSQKSDLSPLWGRQWSGRELKTWEVYNPWKLTPGTKKSPSWKGKSSSKPSFVGSMVIFPGCMLPFGTFQGVQGVSLKWWLNNLKYLPQNGLHNPNLAYPYPTMPESNTFISFEVREMNI